MGSPRRYVLSRDDSSFSRSFLRLGSAPSQSESRFSRSHSVPQKKERLLVQNFQLIWLDDNHRKFYTDHTAILSHLRRIIIKINMFNDVTSCFNFIEHAKGEKIFMIVSGSIGEKISRIIQNCDRLHVVYVFCQNPDYHSMWARNISKIEGVYTKLQDLRESISRSVAQYEKSMIAISCNGIDANFAHSKLLKDALNDICETNEGSINKFVEFCRQSTDLNEELIRQIEVLYKENGPLVCYTNSTIFYTMLNRGFNQFDTIMIENLSFFMKALNERIQMSLYQILQQSQNQSLVLYRGQALPDRTFQKIFKTKGNLMSFHNFFAVSNHPGKPLHFAKEGASVPNMVGVIFKIIIDSRLNSSSRILCQLEHGRTVSSDVINYIISPFNIFRVQDIKQVELDAVPIVEVELTFVSYENEEFKRVTQNVSEQIKKIPSTGWFRFAWILFQLHDFKRALPLFQKLFHKVVHDEEKDKTIFYMAQIYSMTGKYKNALESYSQMLEIRKKSTRDEVSLASVYELIGIVNAKMYNFSEAIRSVEEALKILKQAFGERDNRLISCYENLGIIYGNVADYEKALSYHKMAVKIREQSKRFNPLDMATSYRNIGNTHADLGQYHEALEYYNKSLDISNKTYPIPSLDQASSHQSIGNIFYKIRDYKNALDHHIKSLEIRQKLLEENDLDIGFSYGNIALVHLAIGDYDTALGHFQKTLKIMTNLLSPNHPAMASYYGNMGLLYQRTGDYRKSRESYEKSLVIRLKVFSKRHPIIASSRESIGDINFEMGEYQNAIQSYLDSLNIRIHILPKNHPDVASSYRKIGNVYSVRGSYNNALEFYQKSLEILSGQTFEHQLDMADTYESMGNVYRQVHELEKALDFYKKTLEIRQKSLSEKDLELAHSYVSIGLVYEDMTMYDESLKNLTEAAHILREALPETHKDVKNVEEQLVRVSVQIK